MLVKNLKQKTVWEVEGDLLSRLLSNPDFEMYLEGTKKELIKIAEDMNIEVNERMTKAEIKSAIRGD